MPKRNSPERAEELNQRRELYHLKASSMPPFHYHMIDQRAGKSKYIPAGQYKNIPATNR